MIVAVVVIWITATGRWHRVAWAAPGPIAGDTLEVAARIQAAHENWTRPWDLYGHIARLGAPVGADWSGYPVSDRPEFWVAGFLGAICGPLAAINWLMLAGYAAGAVSFYLCARFLRWPTPWAMAGSVVFAFANFNFRWSPSLSLGLTFTLPPACLLFQWVARPAPALGTRGWRRLAIALGLAFGVGNPYFAFLAAQLAVFAGLLQLGRGAHRARLRAVAGFLIALAAGALVTAGPTMAARWQRDAGSATIVRNYHGVELYALKPVELFMPPYNHRLAAFARFGSGYEGMTMLRGEPWGPYLGVIGGLSFLGLLGTGVWTAVRLRRPGRIPDAALAAGWVLLFSSVGGVNSVLGLAGLDIFRATNRYSVFLLTWALFFGLGWLQRRLRPLRSAAWIPAVLLAAFAVADQMPAPPPAGAYRAAAATLAADRLTAERLAAATSPGAAIFQLPAVPFPEVPPRLGFTDYQHFRLYLAGSTLRYSYGGMRGSLAANWSRMISRLPAHQMVTELEAAGFSVLLIDRRAYADRADTLVEEIAALPRASIALPESPDLAAFRLLAAAHPVPPNPDDPRFLAPWRTAVSPTAPGPALYAARGWFAAERDGRRIWRWFGRNAVLALWRETGEPENAEMSTFVSSLAPGRLVISLNGREVWSGRTNTAPTSIHGLILNLAPGANRVSFEFSGNLLQPRGDVRRLGLMVRDLSVTYVR